MKHVAWIFNVHPDDVDLIPDSIKSFKYSRAQAMPREVELPVKMTLRVKSKYTNAEEEKS